MTKSIYLCGVGGQGTILVSKILTSALIQMGYDVKMSEIHGMSQRGGSVVTQIRFGENVYSPSIGFGEADIIVAFEKIEALRALPYLKKGGTIVLDPCEIYPMSVLTGNAEYPHNAIDSLETVVENLTTVNAAQIARTLGNKKAQNIVLLGALVRAMGLQDKIDWEILIRTSVPAKAVQVNLKAFRAGCQL